MISRILALTLAVLVGNPTCWCCVPKVETVQKAEADHACCALKQSGATLPSETSNTGHDSDPCACEMSKSQRDAAKAQTSIPPLVALALPPAFPGFNPASLLSHDAQVQKLSMDTGPPRWSEALFQRYCSRLL